MTGAPGVLVNFPDWNILFCVGIFGVLASETGNLYQHYRPVFGVVFCLIASGVGKGQRVGEVEPVHGALYWPVSGGHHRQVEMQKLPGCRPDQGIEKVNRVAGYQI